MSLGQVPSQWLPDHECQHTVGRTEEEQEEEGEGPRGPSGGGTWHVRLS